MKKLNILIVNGAQGISSGLFRSDAVAKSFKKMDWNVTVISVEEFRNADLENINILYMVRCALFAWMEEKIEKIKTNKIPLISDFDDLVFRPDLIDEIDGVRYITTEEKQNYKKGMGQYRNMIEKSDLVVVTTDALKSEVNKINSNCIVLKNYPLQDAIISAKKVKEKGIPKRKIIGYYSGTLTHQADFKVCSGAVARFLLANPEWKLRIVGKFILEEFNELERVRSQVEQIGLLSYQEMIVNMAECTVVLAPLEKNIFCECKSELKYFDAALVNVPIIATDTEIYKKVIKYGSNGLYVHQNINWDLELSKLTNLEFMNKLGKGAFIDVISFYGEVSAKNEHVAVVMKGLDIVCQSKPIVNNPSHTQKRPKVGMILPDIAPGSGGHRKALKLCEAYTMLGGEVEIAFISDKSDRELKQIVNDYYFNNCGHVRAFGGNAIDCELAIATSWSTAYEVVKWEKSHRKFYFIQDFEPLFHPMSTNYIKAYHTYKLGLSPICFGDWNRIKIKKEFGYDSPVVKFPIDRNCYYPRCEYIENTIVFYARPSQPRRAFEFGLSILLNVIKSNPNINIYVFGEIIDQPLPEQFKQFGKITDLNKIAELYSKGSLGLSFSTTNPSLIPFEMLACGLPVIDLDLGMTSNDFEGCNALIKLEPNEVLISNYILNLINDVNKLNVLRKTAIEWASTLPCEEDFAISSLKLMELV